MPLCAVPSRCVQGPPIRGLELDPVTRPFTGPIRRVDAYRDNALDIVFPTRGERVDDAAVQLRGRAPRITVQREAVE